MTASPEAHPLRETVLEKLTESWDDFVSDTGCFPPDFTILPRRRLMFVASTWAGLFTDALLAPGGPIASDRDRLVADLAEAEQRITNLANAVSSAHRARRAQEVRANESDDRRVTLEKDRIHPAFSVEVQEHRQQAYEGGWSDGYAEGLARGQSSAEAELATLKAAAARKDEENARLRESLKGIEVLRSLSETAARGEWSVCGVRRRVEEPSCVIIDAPSCPVLFALPTGNGAQALEALRDARFAVAAVNFARAALTATETPDV